MKKMNIVKTFAASALMAMCAVSASAASGYSSYLFDNPDNEVYFGVRASLDISSAANGGAYYSNEAGFALGGIYNIPLCMNLYFEPGLSVFYNTFGTMKIGSYTESVEIPDPETGEPVPGEKEIFYNIDGSIRNFGFRIPMMVGYHFDFTDEIKVHVYTGPQLNMSILARYHQNEVRVAADPEGAFSESIFGTGGFKHFDMQWKFGVGVDYQKYYLGLSGSWGISRMKDATESLQRHLRRNLFSITLGYNF